VTAVGDVRGAPLFVETSRATPLVHFSFITRRGAVTDPVGKEGLSYHQAELARRGAGARNRAELDEALDQLGASLDMHVGRDSISLSGLCLSRNLDRVIGIATDILGAPSFSNDEHEKLIRETNHDLDEMRDDDGSLVGRYFTRYCVPGHPYARTVLGTADSLSRIDLPEVRDRYHQRFAAQNMLVGFAGDMARPTERAKALLDRQARAGPITSADRTPRPALRNA
jgi:zinc protease